MKHGCAVVATATVIAVLGLAPMAAQAGCNVRNPTACTADTPLQADPAAAPQAQPQASQPQTEAAAKPLQLKRYIKLGPARRSVSRSAKRRVVRNRSTGSKTRAVRKQPPKVAATASAEAGAPLAPKAIPTVSIAAKALAVAPAADDRTVGFAAETTPWEGTSAFASADKPEPLPPGVSIARFDELNEIDRAADAAPAAKSDSLASVSLVTPAHAAPARQTPTHKPESDTSWRSWLSWLYGKTVDGIVAAALAVRSIFV